MFLTKNDFCRNLLTQRNKVFYKSKTNLDEGIKIKNIKKILNENEKNKEGFYTTRKNKNNFKKNYNVSIPNIFTVSRNKRKEHNIWHSQIRKENIKYIPNIFPFIVVDTLNKKECLKKRNINDNNNVSNVIPIRTISNVTNIKFKNLIYK